MRLAQLAVLGWLVLSSEPQVRGGLARPPPVAAAAAAAAAEDSAAETGSRGRALDEEGALAVGVVVAGTEGKEGGGVLVPTFCPSAPFSRYAALHRKIMEGELEPRYLMYRPYLYCGMGNRLKGFRGVLALAMMTDRALLVDWYGGQGSSSVQESHKYEDNFIEAHGVPWETFPSFFEGDNGYENFSDGETGKGSTEVWCQMLRGRGVTTPCDESRLTPDFLSTAEWDQIYAKNTKVVIVQSHNGNPADFLRLNENASVGEVLQEWDGLFDVSAGLFDTCALRFLFKARPEFQGLYCEHRSSVLGGKPASVSLHIRTGDDLDYHPEWYETLPQDIENFVECAAGFDDGLAMVAANSSGPDSDLFGPFKYGADSVWLLGTDHMQTIDIFNEGNITAKEGGKVVFIEGDESHRTHTGSKGGLGHSNAGPLIDLALLTEAPLLVGSYRSTFSENSAVVGGLPVSLRLFLLTPFNKLWGGKYQDWDRFDDYRHGCRDLVSNPSVLDDLRFSLRARLEPWIACET